MENAESKYLGALSYEFLGTAFIMYAMVVDKGEYGTAAIYVTFAMMVIAWNISGGHFNPCFSVATLIGNFNGKNIVLCVLMIVCQFLGAFFGILLGYLAVIDKTYTNAYKKLLDDDKGYGNVPLDWVGQIKPVTYSTSTKDFDPEW